LCEPLATHLEQPPRPGADVIVIGRQIVQSDSAIVRRIAITCRKRSAGDAYE